MIDWNDLRFLLVLARRGSLVAAGTELKVAASTVGRRLGALEAALGVRLLNKTPAGYAATAAGDDVREKAESIEAIVDALERRHGRQDAECSGRVRITCSESLGNHVIAPTIPLLQRRFPNLTVDLHNDNRPLSLAMREADIAVRLNQPVQQEVVTRCIGRILFGLYASAENRAERDDHRRRKASDLNEVLPAHEGATDIEITCGLEKVRRWRSDIFVVAANDIAVSDEAAVLVTHVARNDHFDATTFRARRSERRFVSR